MKSIIQILLTLFIAADCFAQSTTLPTVIKRIEGFKHPESVAYDGKYYYVSNLGAVLDPMAKDGDGFISKLNKYGDIVELNAFPKLKFNSPKGLTVMDEILFVADVDSVIGIDVKTKQVLWGKTFDGTYYLNDILTRDENTIYLSSSDKNEVYEIDLLSDSVRVLPIPNNLLTPNGLAADLVSSYLYIATFGDDKNTGEIGRFNLRTNEYERAFEEFGKFDGIFYASGKYYISDWGKDGKGRMLIYEVRSGNIRELKPETGYFQGPADFYVDLSTRKIWLPCMIENAVYILSSR